MKIRSKENFSWTKNSGSYTQDSYPMSKLITDIRKLQRLLLISLDSLEREDLKNLKFDINYLYERISKFISSREVPSNISRDYENLVEDVKHKIFEIDKRILG